MGLIKTGLTLAGGYGLIMAASKAVNDYKDKKQRRSNQSQYQPQEHYYPGYEPHMGYMQENQVNNHPYQPQLSYSSEAQYHQGNHNSNNYSLEMQSRSVRETSSRDNRISQSPQHYRGLATERQGGT